MSIGFFPREINLIGDFNSFRQSKVSVFVMFRRLSQHLFGYVEEDQVEESFPRNAEARRGVDEFNVALIGESGTGKSSFVNVISGYKDCDDYAAKVGVTKCSQKPTPYFHQLNPKIKFWDFPGMGTPNFPVDTYCDLVGIDQFDAFLIFTDTRFRANDLKLAEKISSIDKTFFFIRTKIDENVRAEKRSKPPGSFNEEAMLEEIRADCSKNLRPLQSNTEGIFLISNHHPAKWEFDRLRKAILDVLPRYQRESLTLSLGVLESLSTEMLKRKVEVLKGRIWMVASASAAAAMVPIPGLSVAVDIGLMIKEITFYRTQLGLPEEGSAEFANLQVNTQEKVRRMCLTTAAQVTGFLTAYAAEASVEEFARFVPLLGLAIAGGMSFATTYYALRHCLEKVEETALSVLVEAAHKSADDLDID